LFGVKIEKPKKLMMRSGKKEKDIPKRTLGGDAIGDVFIELKNLN